MSISIPHPGGEGAVGVSTHPGGGRAGKWACPLNLEGRGSGCVLSS